MSITTFKKNLVIPPLPLTPYPVFSPLESGSEYYETPIKLEIIQELESKGT